jgi:hypothetical protein
MLRRRWNPYKRNGQKARLRNRAEGETEAVGDDGFDDADHRHLKA